jgi:hypothetical protein
MSFGGAAWSSCLSWVQTWAQIVQEELLTPDPWAALPGLATNAEISIAADVTNTEFSVREADQIARGLKEIQAALLIAAGQSREKIELVHREIRRLEENSRRMGRKDWLNQAIGTLLMVTWAIAAPPDITKQVFALLKQAVSGVVHLLPQIIATSHAIA